MTPEQEDTLRDALAGILSGPIVSRFIVIAETIDPETGEQQLEHCTPDTQPIWSTMGDLTHTLTVLQAVTHWQINRTED